MFTASRWLGLLATVSLLACSLSVARADQTMTLSSIEKNYHGAKILNVTHYGSQYILIDYQYPTAANHFDLYDLDTGTRYNLPLGADYTQLDKTVNQNEMVFHATGVNSEVPQNVFPFVAVCTRKSANSQFGITEYPEYLNVNQSFRFINGRNGQLVNYGFSRNGIEFQFGPLKSDIHGSFYADSTWIPTTHISYSHQRNQLTIRFAKTLISPHFSVSNDPVDYIGSVHMQAAQGDTSIVVQLKPGTEYYNAKVTWKDSQHNIPVLQLSFLPKNVTLEPGVVIFHDASGGQVDHFLTPIFSQDPPTANSAVNTSSSKSMSMTEAELLKILPKGAQLIPFDSRGNLIRAINLSNSGANDYAALYHYPNAGVHLVGAVVVAQGHDDSLHVLWQHGGLVAPASFSTADMLNDGETNLIFKATIGAMANFYSVLAWENGHVKPIFQASSARMDFVTTKDPRPTDIATWSLDTGILYKIQLYGWDGQHQQYKRIPNTRAPQYFTQTVIPYYQSLAKGPQGKQVPKMIAYGLASAYYDAGNYQAGLTEANRGLAMSRNAYPPTPTFVGLINEIEIAAANSSVIPARHVLVRIANSVGNAEMALAVQSYLERVSDPTVYKQFTILKVTYGGKKFGHAVWTINLDVEHQPHHMSAYNQGLNSRYVIYTVKNHHDVVTGLATGK